MTMSIDEFKKSRQELEAELVESIQKIIGKFEAETGVSPRGVTVQMANTQRLMDENPKYFVVGVDVDAPV
jgi:hypothetical protein